MSGPVAPNTGIVEPMEMHQGAGVAEFDEDADHAELDLHLETGKDLEDPYQRQKMEYERFMHETVRIQVHETAEEDADQIFDLAVNNRRIVLRRGEIKDVPRWAVETLARAKPATYANEEYIDRDGIRKVRYPMRQGVRYPFSVIHDPNPKGPDWLASVLTQQ